MHLKRMRLTQFKVFQELEVGLENKPSLVVLCGPNGSGKSSLVDAFATWRLRQHWGVNDPEFYRRGGDRGTGEEHQIQLEFHEGDEGDAADFRSSIYVRTAQRITVEFTSGALQRMEAAKDRPGPRRSIDLDDRVAENFQHLVTQSVEALWDETARDRPVGEIVDRLVGAIAAPLERLIPGLRFDGPDKPFENTSTFRFTKNGISHYSYKQLSGGEKAVFDLLLDAVLKREEFPDAIWCIDEPELHVNPRIQGELLKEVCQLLPETIQLWACTHSAGMLAQARNQYREDPGSVAFVDMGGLDLSQPGRLAPVVPDRPFWKEQLAVSLGDMASLLAPKKVVLCEGYPSAGRRSKAQWDSRVLEIVFSSEFPDVGYFSVGNSDDVVGDKMHLGEALTALTDGVETLRVIDRDARSDEEVQELVDDGCRVLRRRHLEAYLLDDEVVEALCRQLGKPELSADLCAALQTAVAASIERGNPPDDLKSAAGEFVVAARRLLGQVAGGNDQHSYLRDTLAPCLRPGMASYDELREDVFGGGLP
jgi:predicted ATPase